MLEELYIEIQSISAFINIVKFADFCCQNTDVSRTRGLLPVINVFFGSSSGKV